MPDPFHERRRLPGAGDCKHPCVLAKRMVDYGLLLISELNHFVAPDLSSIAPVAGSSDWFDHDMNDFMDELYQVSKPLHITCVSKKIAGKNFGLEIIFEINSLEHSIKKIIDNEDKSVRFEFEIKK